MGLCVLLWTLKTEQTVNKVPQTLLEGTRSVTTECAEVVHAWPGHAPRSSSSSYQTHTRTRDALTLEVLHPHVADLPDKFLPLEPVFPLVSSHLEARRVLQGPRAGSLGKLPRVEEKEKLLLLQWAGGLSIVRLTDREPCKPGTQAETTARGSVSGRTSLLFTGVEAME